LAEVPVPEQFEVAIPGGNNKNGSNRRLSDEERKIAGDFIRNPNYKRGRMATMGKQVDIVACDGQVCGWKFHLWEEAPEDPEQVRLDLHFAGERSPPLPVISLMRLLT